MRTNKNLKNVKIRKEKWGQSAVKMILAVWFLIAVQELNAQNVGINATGVPPHSSAGLDLKFSDKGLLVPRVSLSNVSVYNPPITAGSSARSLLVYNTNTAVVGGNGEGFYYWDSVATKWNYIAAPGNGPGGAGQVLVSQGANNPPQWSTLSVSGGGGTTGCANCVSMISPASSSTMNWASCRDYCRSGTWGGYTDWRMPTFDEAINYNTNAAIAPNGGWASSFVWTSTPWDARVGGTPSTGGWVVFHESNGNWNYNFIPTPHYCRCVR